MLYHGNSPVKSPRALQSFVMVFVSFVFTAKKNKTAQQNSQQADEYRELCKGRKRTKKSKHFHIKTSNVVCNEKPCHSSL